MARFLPATVVTRLMTRHLPRFWPSVEPTMSDRTSLVPIHDRHSGSDNSFLSGDLLVREDPDTPGLGHMATTENLEEAIEVLQQLGLKEYEARCFVGLSRVETGTAKKLSEMTDVPRTRIYDAIRVLEAQGLVEIQHSSPQRFRAVSLDEATETLRDQYEARVERLHGALDPVEIIDSDDDAPVQQVWAMTGRQAIENRTDQLVEAATDEIVL